MTRFIWGQLLRARSRTLALASGILVATGLAFQLSSTGFSMSLQRLAPKPSNFNVVSKLKSAWQRGFASAIQGVALIIVFGLTIYWMAEQNASRLLLLPLASLEAGLQTVRGLCIQVLWKAVAFFVLFGVIDLFRQKRRFAKQMKMSKQDVRDEMKETEGNPQTKMRIRRLQRDTRRHRMMEEIKTATALTSACAMRGAGPATLQIANVRTATASTIGTK